MNRKHIIKAFIPLVVFLSLIVLLYNGLGKDTNLLPSALIDKPAPQFNLPSLMNDKTINNETLKGQMYLLNVWASWCPSCRIEHPIIAEFAKQNIIPVYGLNYKDEDSDAKRWLRQFGDPYKDVLVDIDGLVGIDFGVYGVPETYLVDANGIIRHKIVGEVSRQKIRDELLPLIEKFK